MIQQKTLSSPSKEEQKIWQGHTFPFPSSDATNVVVVENSQKHEEKLCTLGRRAMHLIETGIDYNNCKAASRKPLL